MRVRMTWEKHVLSPLKHMFVGYKEFLRLLSLNGKRSRVGDTRGIIEDAQPRERESKRRPLTR